jgi:threonine synthase
MSRASFTLSTDPAAARRNEILQDTFEVVCHNCGAMQALRERTCAACSGPLGFQYDYASVRWDERYPDSMWRYRSLLPIEADGHIVTLGEGGTPLLPSRSYAGTVFLKDETRNPTGSLKDRPLALAVTKAVQLEHNCSIVVSAGSTGISDAAFAARAGLKSIVVVGGSVPDERLQPLFTLGAEVITVEGEIDEVLARSEEVAQDHRLYLSSTCRTSNPYQAEAAETIAYEIVEQLGTFPD